MNNSSEKKLAFEDINLERISISDARKDLSKLVHTLASEPNRIFELDRRDAPSALLLSFAEYSPVISAFQSGNLKTLLATFVIKKWLGAVDVPSHLSKPQLKELEAMELSQLVILFQARSSTSIKSLMKMGDFDEVLVARLIKRSKIAKAIAETEKDKLYDVSEHLAGAE